jgi:hypothetical protein
MKHLNKFWFIIFALMLVGGFYACKKDKKTNSTECKGTIPNGKSAATNIPSSATGKYELTYNDAATGSPFTNGTKASVELTSDKKLRVTIGSKSVLVSNPWMTNDIEANFDETCVFSVRFSPAFVSGALHEINVSTLSGAWKGQFRR